MDQKSIRSIRRANMKILVARQPNQSAAAELLETTPPYISVLLNGRGPIGTHFARRVELKFGMPVGWMDVDHSGPTLTRVMVLDDTDLMLGETGSIERDLSAVTFEEVSSSAFAYSVKGDSMSGMIFEGDIAIVDPEVRPAGGSIVLVKSGNGVFVRQYITGIVGNPILKPANSQFPTSELTTELKVLGVIVEAQSRRKLRIAA